MKGHVQEGVPSYITLYNNINSHFGGDGRWIFSQSHAGLVSCLVLIDIRVTLIFSCNVQQERSTVTKIGIFFCMSWTVVFVLLFL